MAGILKMIRKHPALLDCAVGNLSHRFRFRLDAEGFSKRCHAPELLTVMVTDRCNLRCRYCHYANTDQIGYQLNQVSDLSSELFRRLIDETPGHPVVSLTGGEPLLHPHIGDLIAYAKKKNHVCTLTTNGWFLAQKGQEISEAGLDILVVSMDGPEEIHDAVRGKNSFARLRAGIEFMQGLSDRPALFISTAISDFNYDQLLHNYQMVRDWQVDGLNIQHLWMQTDEMIDSFQSQFSILSADHVRWRVNISQIETDILADQLEQLRRENWGNPFIFMETPYLNREEIDAWYRQPDQMVKYETVRCAWARLKVWSDGKVKPCRDWEVGNLNEKSAAEIWHGEEYQKFRILLEREGILPICYRCCAIVHR
jgi:MoaA/NifB/PqqE/SkfB family radical SAM enzyme